MHIRYRMIIFISLLFIVMTFGCGRNHPPANSSRFKPVPKVTVWKVESREVTYDLQAVGTMEIDEVRVHAGVEGIVSKLMFREGDSVQEESVLLEVDPQRYQLELAKAKAEWERSDVGFQKARMDFEKRKRLHEKGIVTDDELLNYETVMMEAKAQVDWVKASHDLALKNERDAHIRPSRAGLVQGKMVQLGQFVNRETLIATLIDFSTLRVRFALPVSDSTSLKIGQEVNLFLKANQVKAYTARIFYISDQAHPQTRMVECKADQVQTKDEASVAQLKPGSYVDVKLELDRRNALVVPTQAVVPTEKGHVAYVLWDKKVESRVVEVGHHISDEWLEIISGLSADEVIIVKGSQFVRDGMEVEIIGE